MAHGAFALRAVRGGTEQRSTRKAQLPKHRAVSAAVKWLLALLLAAITANAFAQEPDPAQTYSAAEAAYAQALAADLGRTPTPDDAVWRAAIDAAELATQHAETAVESARAASGPTSDQVLSAEVGLRDALALTARVYGSVHWHSRAFAHWDRFVAEGGEILAVASPPRGLAPGLVAGFPTDLDFATTALNQLAFARYEAGDNQGARAYYFTLLDIDPADPEALRWLGRMAFEEGDTATAIEIWGRLVQVAPDDEGARFFLELSREREEFGVAVSEAYRAGIRAYESGLLVDALAHFESAYAANPDFTDAAVWAARSAFELGRPAVAEPYWQAALAADPDDARSAWFLEVTRAQIRWGVAAANDFYAGQSAYATGDLEQAEELFLSAAERNPQYVDAWVWAARSSQEAGRAEQAINLWQEVLRLDPGDDRARYFLQVARQQLAFGPEAGNAFVRGMDAYQVGDVEGARSGFTAAVEAAPTFAAAWSQLGRVEFQVGNFAAAAAAYGRALELEPGNDEYEFFAAEARRLAELNDPAGAEPAEEAPAHEETPAPEEPDSTDEPDTLDEPDSPDDTPAQEPDVVPLPPPGPGGSARL